MVEAWVSHERHRAGGAGPRRLQLGYNPEMRAPALGRVLAALAMPAARGLRYLGLGHVGWDERGARHPLMDRFIVDTLPNVAAALEELVLECNKIGLPAMRALAACTAELALPRLHTLDLTDNIPTRAQTRALTAQLARNVPTLTAVCLCCGL